MSTTQRARPRSAVVDRAREQAAEALGVPARGVVFTAGATEANNTALLSVLAGGSGASSSRAGAAPHLVITQAEHPSVLEPAAWLERHAGVRVTRLPVDGDGLIERGAFDAALADAPTLVALLWANNETGVVQPMETLAPAVRASGARLHVDATQWLGKVPVDLAALPIDSVACSAHKLGGPKGTGCLASAHDDWPGPLLHGGPQERRRRGGTENTAGSPASAPRARSRPPSCRPAPSAIASCAIGCGRASGRRCPRSCATGSPSTRSATR